MTLPASHPIAIIGGGPAGALAAARLANAGSRVLLFDEKLAWEKPCGGGITPKALADWPFLRDAEAERNWVDECELIAPSGRRASFCLDRPIAIFSRQTLNGLLLEKARNSGAEIIRDRVLRIERDSKNWLLHSTTGTHQAAFVVLAAGARDTFRNQFSKPFAPQDLMITAGYYIPGKSRLMQVEFLEGLQGYIWIFPRADHFSAGICGKMTTQTTAELRRLLELSLRRFGLDFQGARFFAHVLPSLRAATLRDSPVNGEGWAMIGDTAGFVDPITGEGLYYAMRSAELVSAALLAGQPESYPKLLCQDFLADLEMAARLADRFYNGSWMGGAVAERMVQFTALSSTLRDIMRDLFAGTQNYHTLRRNLYHRLPAMLIEGLASTLRFTKEPAMEAHSSLGQSH